MANMTLAIPDEIHKLMKEQADIKWSEVARQAFLAKLAATIKTSSSTKKQANPEDFWELSDKIHKAAAIRFINDHNRRHQHHHSSTLKKRAR
jgi:hypothetical protein